MTDSASASAARSADQRVSPRRLPLKLVWHLVVLAGAVTMVYPVLWMIVSSLRPENHIFGNASLLLTDPPKVANYVSGWLAFQRPFGMYMINSAILSGGAVAGNVLSCSMAAYAFARLTFPGRRVGIAIVVGTLLLPGSVTFVSQYVIYSKLGLINTFAPLLLPKFLATNSFFVFLLMQFIRGIPRELDQAARIDGCGPIRTFFVVIAPLIRPALATTAIFTFIAEWNDYLGPLVYLTKERWQTAAVALTAFGSPDGPSDYGQMFAMGLITLVPMFVIFTIFQRSLIQGISSTGFK